MKQTPKIAVCQVFEKVNTGGVSLTVFELVTAGFAADGYNLREDWEGTHDDVVARPAPAGKIDCTSRGPFSLWGLMNCCKRSLF